MIVKILLVKLNMLVMVETEVKTVAHKKIKILHAIVCKKTGYIVNHCLEPALIPKDNNKNKKALRTI